jgi:glucose/arabinose dehydrogenase
MTQNQLSRRRLLRAVSAPLVAGLAGCTLPGQETVPTGESTTPTTSQTADTPRGEQTSPVGTETQAGVTTTAQSTGGDDGAETTETAASDISDLTVRAERVAAGFDAPLGLEIPQAGRRFVVDQPGQIYLQDETGVRSDPFLDVTDRMVSVRGYSEQGLLGLAFHPEFTDNGRFFVRYSAPSRESTPDDFSHTFVLSEFRADPGATTADDNSEQVLLEVPQPQSNHNAGAIAFGPDGYLYVAVGDGGAADDRGTGHVDDWYDDNAGGNGQDVTENLLGSILRIDVDNEGADTPYAIPDDNPLVGEDGLSEQYAWGLRNPWRMSFTPNGRLLAADVGQGAWEEVNVIRKGGNYGWNVREGTHCFGSDDCPGETPDGNPLLDPVIEYPHGGQPVSGISVIGGYLYDGEDLPSFDGLYLFADWRANGQLFAARPVDDGLWEKTTVSVDSEPPFGPNVLSFGRNPAGELFVCTTGDTAGVFRLKAA